MLTTGQMWVGVISGVVALAVTVGTVIYHAGKVNQHVADIDRTEQRILEKVSSIDQRLSRVEGYLSGQANGYDLP